MTEFYDDDCSFERVTRCRFLKLYISMFEKWLSVTAMADGSEQMRSAHARDVSLGARIAPLGHNELNMALNGLYEWTPGCRSSASLMPGFHCALISRKPNVRKQCNGFPPNYIHSLDATHMMLTAIYCLL